MMEKLSSLPADSEVAPLAGYLSPSVHSPACQLLPLILQGSNKREHLKNVLEQALRVGGNMEDLCRGDDNLKLSSMRDYIAQNALCLVANLVAISELVEEESLSGEFIQSALKEKDAVIDAQRQEILELKALIFDEQRLMHTAPNQIPLNSQASSTARVVAPRRAVQPSETKNSFVPPSPSGAAPHTKYTGRHLLASSSVSEIKTNNKRVSTSSSSSDECSLFSSVATTRNESKKVDTAPSGQQKPDTKPSRKKCFPKKRVSRVSCDSTVDSSLCSSARTNNLHTNRLSKKKPHVQLCGVDSVIHDDHILGILKRQNRGLEDFSERDIKIKFHREDRTGSKEVIAEVTPELFQKLMELKKVSINSKESGSLCSVEKRIRLTRCFRCQRFGHKQTECKNALVCAGCAGSHHTKDCTVAEESCSNCVWSNKTKTPRHRPTANNARHRADAPNCPFFHRMYRLEESLIDFGATDHSTSNRKLDHSAARSHSVPTIDALNWRRNQCQDSAPMSPLRGQICSF